MGRESSDALEQAALSFLSGIDTDLGSMRPCSSEGPDWSWLRDAEGIRLDVVSVMAATMLASVDTIIESVGGPTPDGSPSTRTPIRSSRRRSTHGPSSS